jgi:vacuolar iron transporter family protein
MAKFMDPTSHPVLRSRREILQHYLGDVVYGANDGIVTTFAIVAGVAGARLSPRVVLILGLSNLLADGFSMGASNYLAIRSRSSAELESAKVISEPYPFRHGLVTFLAFLTAGSVPLLAYLAPVMEEHRFAVTAVLGAISLFGIGAARTVVASGSWWRSGFEMLSIGGAAAALAYCVGAWVGQA